MLARQLMSGVTESIDVSGYDFGEVTTESTFVEAACESLFTDIYTVDRAYHIADIVGEVKVVREGADAQALLENIITSGIEKLKNAFKKFWAKLKAWFESVKKFFKSFFLKGKDFVKEFRKEIMDKKVTGFKYHAYHFTFKDGDAVGEKIMSAVSTKIDTLASYIKDANGKMDTKKFSEGYGSHSSGDGFASSSDYQEHIIKALNIRGASTASELTDELKKAYRNGEDAAEDFEEFESNDREEMLSIVDGSDKIVKDIEKQESTFEKEVNVMIKALDSIKSSDNEAVYKIAQQCSSRASSLLTLGKIPSTEKVAAYKEAASSFRSILGSFVRFKPAKEGAEVEDEDEKPATESLFDMALNMI